MAALGKFTEGVRKILDKTFSVYNFILLGSVFLVTAYPFWYVVMYSVSNPAKVGAEFLLYPLGFTWESYRQAFATAEIFDAFLVSAARSVIGSVGGTFISLMTAYGLGRKKLAGRRFLTLYFVITMYFSAGMIPGYLVAKNLHLVGSFWVYILPLLMNAYNMILIKNYIESLPESLSESACIDGANDFVIFIKIITPLCKPVLAAVVLFASVTHWNSYTDTLIYCATQPELHTLQYVLMTLIGNVARAATDLSAVSDMANGNVVTPMSVRMAVTVITILPISLVYPFLQKYFIKGLMLGAVKG